MSPRLAFFSIVLGAWVLGVVVRLYGLQVVDHPHYVERAARQQQRVVALHAPRGTIRDARGRELAVSVEVHSVAADPHQVENAAETAAVLARLLDLDATARAALAEQLAGERRFVWVARKPDPQRAAAVAERELPGVFLLPESKRYYPLRTLAAHVLGYVGTDNVGLDGLEARYDERVASQPGRRVVVQDGRFGKVVHPDFEIAEALPGDDLRLTLDAAIQHLVERELARTVARTNAKSGSVVVLDPHSGAVLALASYPFFDPNDFAASPESARRNRVIADAYEPGSTFKAITLAAALGQGAVGLDHDFDCELGSIRLHGRRIRDHKPFGVLSVRQVIARSSNIGALKLGYEAGPEAFYNTIRAFGFGRRTGIDLPGEHEGLLRSYKRWTALTTAYVSFGQGIAITPLQLAAAFAVFANGEHLPQPYVVAAIDGRPVDPSTRRPPTTPAAPSTLRQVRSALESVVLEGTGKPAAVTGYRAAGKTGTAQKAIDGRYARNRYVASFVGFVPVEDPAMVIAVVLDEPWPTYHGSAAAGPAFRSIAEQTLLYLGVRPLREPRHAWPGERQRQVAEATAEEDAAGPLPAGTLPDFEGLSKRRSVAAASRLGLAPALHGNGFVVRQRPAPGTPLELTGDRIELWLTTSHAGEAG